MTSHKRKSRPPSADSNPKSQIKQSSSPARSLMLQGTASHVGKSVLVAGLCRILKEHGFKVAPFKAQNMALNSFVTLNGGEIGRAQAFQAEAAGVLPTIDMNPILLKPTSDMGSQVIIHGKVYGNMKAHEYHRFKKEVKQYVLESYTRLTREYNAIVIEGAGSPAEINLREGDIANMGMAEMVDAPVILIGDIDRGGVFASFVGTMELLTPSEKKRVKGFIINKFRGDFELLKPGIDFLEYKTGLPVFGVVPYMNDIGLPEEDGVVLDGGRWTGDSGQKKINMVVVKLPHISNFTDFDAFKFESDISVKYITNHAELDGADAVIIPGSKNTLEDLAWLYQTGIANTIISYANNGGRVIGICGGFQILGRFIKDPYAVESALKEVRGLGLLNVETILEKDKKTYQVDAEIQLGIMGQGFGVKGYEIHMGETVGNCQIFAVITRRNEETVKVKDGAVANKGTIWGTYIHGIFDNDELRTRFLNDMRIEKRLPMQGVVSCKQEKEKRIKRLAEVVKESIDMRRVYEIMGLKGLGR